MAEEHAHYWTWSPLGRLWRCACGAEARGCPDCEGTGRRLLWRLPYTESRAESCEACDSSGFVTSAP